MARTIRPANKNFTLDQSHLHPAFAVLAANPTTSGKKSGCELFIANALWGQLGYDFLPDYLSLNKKHYDAACTTSNTKGKDNCRRSP
jgi:hypothetical protein